MALLLLEKLKKDINILFGYVRCLMAKSDENCPLVATEWSSNHSNATGNSYTAGTYVFYNGHVYKCLFNNDGILPTNTTYWLDLGEGHLLAEEQSNWNATGGRQYILNKPTNTSDFFNDGENGSPYATMNDVSSAIPQAQDIDSVLFEGDTAPDKDINVQSIGLWDNFTAPFGFARIEADKSRINFISKLGVTMGHISQGAFNLIQGAFSFTINLSSLTSNRVATFQNKSGVIAYLSDITSAGGLVATAWSPDHTTALGNPYLIGTRVWYLGDVYEAIANNDSILPTNASYWTNLGPGYLLDQEPIPDITGLVPYTGATQDVDLGEFGLLTGNIEFDNTPTTIPTTAGSTYWDDTDGTLNLILKGGNVTLQLGQEQVVRVVNKTATNITLLESNYQAVRVTGVQGQRLKVDLAQATNDLLSAETIGLVTETIANNQEGFVTTSGLVRNIDTTGSLQGETWADGDILYLSPTTAGGVTKVKPEAPDHLLIIGYVVYSHASQGTIFVKVNNGYELDELHNVKITGTPANNNLLAYTLATNIWENKTIASILGYTPYRYLEGPFTTYLGSTIGLTETIVAQKEIVGGSFNSVDIIKSLYKFSKVSTVSSVTLRIRINTTNTLVGSVQIATYSMVSANTYALLTRTFNLNGGNLYGYNFASSTSSDLIATNTVGSSTPYNTANNLFVFYTVQLGNIADSVVFQYATFTN
jgi:hypothetical protein